jgi:hypothetical protein
MTRLNELNRHLRGSLLDHDNDHLFKEAQALYETRSNLVHEAVSPVSPDDGNKCMPLTREGTRRALTCAVEIFEWWDVRARQFIPPDDGFNRTVE